MCRELHIQFIQMKSEKLHAIFRGRTGEKHYKIVESLDEIVMRTDLMRIEDTANPNFIKIRVII